MRMAAGFAGALMLLCLSLCAAHAEFYVSTTGSDSYPGTRARPFATLDRARDAIRAIKKIGALPAGGVTVWVRGGVYPIASTFALTAEDSGAKDSPVIYRACDGEQVQLIGGIEITGFKPVRDSGTIERFDPAARGRVLQADLKAQGITDYGQMRPRGFGRPVDPAGLELFFNGIPMTLAGWPNNGWTQIAAVPADPNGGRFNYDGDRPSRWAKADDIWLHGYWTWPWADSYEKVQSIDTKNKEIATCPPHGVYGYKAQRRYRALNVLEELDAPGEWYLDRKTGILYFWPPKPIGKANAIVSIIEKPMVSLTDVSYVTLRGFTIEACRGSAVEISGGTANLIAGCVLRNIGNVAVSINGGTRNGVSGCDIYETGDGGINLAGGYRMTLTPAGNFVENCYIHDFSRWSRTYRPGVLISGVGNRISHNLICYAPHSAIILGGNDHMIEFNEIHDICRETGDAGAFYMGRDWTWRGNEIRFNYFHDLGGYDNKLSFSDTMAVYLDDWASGSRVYGNLFYKANRAVMIGGGRYNTVQNNTFVDCRISVHVDARGIAAWTKTYWYGTDNTMFDRLKAVNGTQPPYSDHYPQLATILRDEPRLPKGNSITRNISIGGQWMAIIDKFDTKMLDIRDNLVDSQPGFSDPQFIDAAKKDFRLKPSSPAFKLGFKQIPIDRIGLYVDDYRKALPAPSR